MKKKKKKWKDYIVYLEGKVRNACVQNFIKKVSSLKFTLNLTIFYVQRLLHILWYEYHNIYIKKKDSK